MTDAVAVIPALITAETDAVAVFRWAIAADSEAVEVFDTRIAAATLALAERGAWIAAAMFAVAVFGVDPAATYGISSCTHETLASSMRIADGQQLDVANSAGRRACNDCRCGSA